MTHKLVYFGCTEICSSNLLIETGEKYVKDVAFITDLSQTIVLMSEELNTSTEQISAVVQTISENMKDTK